MKNVTVRLDDDLVRRAREEAASQGKSLSQFVRELLSHQIGPEWKKSGLEAIDEYLSGPPLPVTSTEDRLPRREELYDERIDEVVRRYERSDLRNR